ncbi:MAG: hypothetical protein RXN89_02890 [Vulcanisaeta sp.]|jgi:hypothetical protein
MSDVEWSLAPGKHLIATAATVRSGYAISVLKNSALLKGLRSS